MKPDGGTANVILERARYAGLSPILELRETLLRARTTANELLWALVTYK